ncbi:DNA-protecting protein DprA [Candidatus Azambacteria bacterium]|nr:DNA-protecting protein DprA [Candidatus Azambacteria bacterium]
MQEIKEVKIKDKNFPESLRNIPKAPERIFVRGEILPEDKVAIAIVGARKCTSYGKQVAYDFAYALAKNGVTIVSGLAIGIDGEAHKGALDAGGRTLAVLGSGIDDNSIYPYSHKSLADRVLENGALISEYEPGTPSLKHQFPERNRIVSGLSLGVLIVEAKEKSGSLITAGIALEQGKDIFAVPGQIFAQSSKGTNKLIQEGAKLVLEPQDILDELEIAGVNIKKQKIELTETEEKILKHLKDETMHINDIIKRSGLAANSVLTAITMLEMKKIIQNIGGNIYTIKI